MCDVIIANSILRTLHILMLSIPRVPCDNSGFQEIVLNFLVRSGVLSHRKVLSEQCHRHIKDKTLMLSEINFLILGNDSIEL